MQDFKYDLYEKKYFKVLKVILKNFLIYNEMKREKI
jgi:hypothetical protein